jgi:hypothetical protein
MILGHRLLITQVEILLYGRRNNLKHVEKQPVLHTVAQGLLLRNQAKVHHELFECIVIEALGSVVLLRVVVLALLVWLVCGGFLGALSRQGEGQVEIFEELLQNVPVGNLF